MQRAEECSHTMTTIYPEAGSVPGHLRLTMQRLIRRETGSHGWQVQERSVEWPAARTALIIVDMWDRHWSRGATSRVGALAPHINAIACAVRGQGGLVVHAPSDVTGEYGDHPARQHARSAPHHALPPLREHLDPPLPIDDSDEGSDTGEDATYQAWSSQHPAIMIAPADALSDDLQEIHNTLQQRSVLHLLYAGVHLNMCVLNRPFGIKRMVRLGYDVALIRDATDTMYNPYMPPYVSHAEGTELVVRYVAQFWCPTIDSSDLTLPFD
jgi:nicotinamidase-related amidase